MAHDKKYVDEVLAAWDISQSLPNPPSQRTFAKLQGVPLPSFNRWLADRVIAPEPLDTNSETRERDLASVLLQQAFRLLADIHVLPSPKEQADRANAIGKLIEKAQTLSGMPSDRTEVTHVNGMSVEELDKLLGH